MASTKDKQKKADKVVVERDVRDAEERQADAEAAAQQAEEDFDASEPGELVDSSRLPLNHPTILMPTDTQPPPEATPREGKTSPAIPASVPAAAPDESGEDATTRDAMVEATALGYYDHIRRRPGDVFAIRKRDFSTRWMKKAHPDVKPTPVRLSNAVIAQQFQQTIAARRGGRDAGLDQAAEANPFRDD